jgi:hypothetical protein
MGTSFVPIDAADLVHAEDHPDPLQGPQEVQIVAAVLTIAMNDQGPATGPGRLGHMIAQAREGKLDGPVQVIGRSLGRLLGVSGFGRWVEERIVGILGGIRRRSGSVFLGFGASQAFFPSAHSGGQPNQASTVHGGAAHRLDHARRRPGADVVPPAARSGTLGGQEALFHQPQRIFHRHTMLAGHPHRQHRELGIGVIIAAAIPGWDAAVAGPLSHQKLNVPFHIRVQFAFRVALLNGLHGL